MYRIKSRKSIKKSHRNQLKRFIENERKRLEEPMEWLYDTFQILTLLQLVESMCTSARERTGFLRISTKRMGHKVK